MECLDILGASQLDFWVTLTPKVEVIPNAARYDLAPTYNPNVTRYILPPPLNSNHNPTLT